MTTGTCTYDRFDTLVGEPRGIEHSRYIGSQAGLMSADWFTRPFDWVFFNLSLTMFLLNLVPVLLNLTMFY